MFSADSPKIPNAKGVTEEPPEGREGELLKLNVLGRPGGARRTAYGFLIKLKQGEES